MGLVVGCLYFERIESLCPKTQTPAQFGVSMDEMAEGIPVYASSSNDSQLDRVDGIDFQTGMRHIIAPAVFGMIVGIIFQEYITPQYNWPSPPQGAILSSIILSPLLYFISVSYTHLTLPTICSV